MAIDGENGLILPFSERFLAIFGLFFFIFIHKNGY